VTVLVADFSNHTGDPVFDGTLEPVVKIALEGAGFITAFDRTAVVRTLGLPVPGRLDELAARQMAVGQGVGVVVSVSIDRQGNGYALSMKAIRAVTGDIIQSADETAEKRDQVVFTATKLTAAVRKAIGDDTSESVQRFAMETLTATSLEAIHDYATAMNAVADGKHEDALRSFSKAVDIDSNFGLAYAGMAIASRNLGQQQDSEKYIKLALGHIDRMTERERYRTRGSYYALVGDEQKCVEEYGALISGFPSDAAAHNNLAVCLTDLRNMPKGIEEMRQAATILPKKTLYRNNIALYASYGSDFATGEREARAVQDLDPSYPTGFIALAFAQLGQGQLKQTADTYQKLAKVSKQGDSNAKSGLADLAIYEGRFADAVRILEQGAAEDLAGKFPDRAAAKLRALAYTRLLQGQKGPAVAAAEASLANSKTVKSRFSAGRVFIAAGQANRAQELAAGLAAELQSEPQAYAKLLEGESALASGDPSRAITVFKEANSLLDTWIGRFDLGRAYLEAGAFAEADSEFDRCIKRRGEALSLFLDQSPTYGYFPPVYYYVGRLREGLKSAGFAESYRTYLSIRGKAGEDPLLAEVRKRAGQ
jgi:tetratricopeptide (TPR) repeat protein